MNRPSTLRNHSTSITALSLMVATASVFGFAASSSWTLFLLAAAVAIVGVPHGGLDHWTGRELLEVRLGSLWGVVFFGAYLATSAVVAFGWLYVPLATAIAFFIISGWHFGMEDERGEVSHPLARHFSTIAVGGLVVWIPSLVQPDRMSEILRAVVPAGFFKVPAIILATQAISICMAPVATLIVVRDLITGKRERAARNFAFALLFALSDPIVSFGIYFCGWHSVRGLHELAKTHHKTLTEIAAAVAPMSIGAIVLALVGMGFWSSGQAVSDATTRTLFISLSAIAVPHLLLHSIANECRSPRNFQDSSFKKLEVAT